MYKNILLPIDINDESSWKKSFPIAIKFAAAFKCKVNLLTVISDVGMALVNQFSGSSAKKIESETKNKLQQLADKNIGSDVKYHCIVMTGNVYESIIKTAKKIDADLIVMSASRPELKDYLLGPNAARVVRHSDRSVLVVRDDS